MVFSPLNAVTAALPLNRLAGDLKPCYNIKTLLTIQHKYYLMQTKQYRCVAVINLSSLKHITNTMCMRIKQIFKSSILPELSLVAFNDFLFFFL